MTEAAQTATPNDARQASMSRVQTQETILAKYVPPQAAQASDPEKKPEVEPSKEAKEPEKQPEAKKAPEPEAKPKKTAQDRIHELAGKHREAEAKAEAAERHAKELEAKLQTLSANAKPLEVDDRPVRSKFATDDDYIDAVTDWKVKQAMATREREQMQARIEAEQAEIAAQWSRRQEEVMKDLPDYADVLGKSEVAVPGHIHEALLESEHGPQIAYYLALNPAEAKRIAAMRPASGILRIAVLARDMADMEEAEAIEAKPKAEPEAEPKEKAAAVPKSKAPPPIEPVKSSPSTTGAPTTSFQEYKARRQAQKRERANA